MEAGFDLLVSGTCCHKLQLKLNIMQIMSGSLSFQLWHGIVSIQNYSLFCRPPHYASSYLFIYL